MNVLHFYRGYGKDYRNSVVEAQIRTLQGMVGIIPLSFNKGGFGGYWQAFKGLKINLKKNKIDIIHAHYSFCGMVAMLTCFPKVVCSLMGSDLLQQHVFLKKITIFFSRFIWKCTIVKSTAMKMIVKKAELIPNGVDLSVFYPISKKTAMSMTELEEKTKNIIFVAENILDPVKNVKLAKEAIFLLNERDIRLITISSLPQNKLNNYYNAADLLLLTSISEGSPNVIKEAMACNCPIVATDVGDIREVIADAEQCYVTGFNASEIAVRIHQIIRSGKRSNGREKILHLDSHIIAEKLVKLYEQVVTAGL